MRVRRTGRAAGLGGVRPAQEAGGVLPATCEPAPGPRTALRVALPAVQVLVLVLVLVAGAGRGVSAEAGAQDGIRVRARAAGRTPVGSARRPTRKGGSRRDVARDLQGGRWAAPACESRCVCEHAHGVVCRRCQLKLEVPCCIGEGRQACSCARAGCWGAPPGEPSVPPHGKQSSAVPALDALSVTDHNQAPIIAAE